jgi:hypothetical protein
LNILSSNPNTQELENHRNMNRLQILAQACETVSRLDESAGQSRPRPLPLTFQEITPPNHDHNLKEGQSEFRRFTPNLEDMEDTEGHWNRIRVCSPTPPWSPEDEPASLVATGSQSSHVSSPPETPEKRKVKIVSYGELDKLVEEIANGSEMNAKMLRSAGSSSIWLPDNHFADEFRLVTAGELLKRIKHFLSYRIPGAWTEQGLGAAYHTLWCTPDPWGPAKRMAYVGILEECQSGTHDVLPRIREVFYGGKPSWLEWDPSRTDTDPKIAPKAAKARAPRKSPKSKPVNPAPVEQPRTRRTAQAKKWNDAIPTGPATESLAKSEESEESEEWEQLKKEVLIPLPAKGSRKRKRALADDAAEACKPAKKAAAKTKNTRQAREEGKEGKEGKPMAPIEAFARHIKGTLSARAQEKDHYQAFGDAILPDNSADVDLVVPKIKNAVDPSKRLKDHGNATGLHPSEVALCKDLAITYDTYRCQKARFFLALAVFVEYNHQGLREGRPDFKIWNVGKSQIQLVNNMDVNKLSDMFTAFETWGWVEDMAQKDARTKKFTLSANYLARFPKSHRLPLMAEVANWEAQKVDNPQYRFARVPAR